VSNSGQEQASNLNLSPYRFAVAATFTAEPLARVFEFWARQLGRSFEVRFAPYNQPTQALLDPRSEFSLNTDGLNVLLVRLEDLVQAEAAEPAPSVLEAAALELAAHAPEAARRLSAPLLYCLCPPSPRLASQLRPLGPLVAGRLSNVPGIHFLDFEEIADVYPVDEIYSEAGEKLGRIPYTDAYFAALGTAIVRRADALGRPPAKVIVLDCDNTLWHGVCGEDGPAGVVLEPPRRELHRQLLAQREAGVLLAICSKNNEEDVVQTFRENADMPLGLHHFAARRINWKSKAENLRALAVELKLGLDSFVFIDDDAKECAEVSETVPEVLTVSLPHDPEAIPRILPHLWVLDRIAVTEEDRRRSTYYEQARKFEREAENASSLEEFLAGLDLRVEIGPLRTEQLTRVAQLTQRTNQFNATLTRRTPHEIQDLRERNEIECWTVTVADRFGEYGLTGVVFFRTSAESLLVDTFLLSCRVLGRGVEHHVLARLGAEAVARNLPAVVVPFQEAARNQPMRDFLEGAAAQCGACFANGRYRFPAQALAELQWTQPSAGMLQALPPTPAAGSYPRPDYARIARHFTTAAQILTAIRRQSTAEVSVSPDLTATEKTLARIWCELLQVPSVGPEDNFFDLGGHSLILVLLQLRIREEFAVEIDLDDVYSGTITLADMARRIDALQHGNITIEEYEALVAEIEALSDDEVRELLAREGGQ